MYSEPSATSRPVPRADFPQQRCAVRPVAEAQECQQNQLFELAENRRVIVVDMNHIVKYMI